MTELLHDNVSKVFRARSAGDWEHIDVEPYKATDDGYHGITRRELVGKRGESPAFHLRYFEIARGGYSTMERHTHEHAVVVCRGAGEVVIGCRTIAVAVGDVVYVAPDDPHQFRNPDSDEPFGFYCIVNADRDRPRPVDGSDITCAICE